MQVDEVSSKQPLVGKMEDDDDKLSQLLSADRPEDIGEDSFFETGGLKVQAQSTRPQVFNSYLEIAHMFGLGRVVADGLEPGWSWLTDYVKSVTSLDAITSRTGTNERYLASVVGEIDGGGGGGGGQDSSQPKWVTECDMELIQWSSEIPTDFQLGGN